MTAKDSYVPGRHQGGANEHHYVPPSSKLAELVKIQQQAGDKMILPLVEAHLLARWGPDPDRATGMLHVSEMAKKDWCERASYLRITSDTWPAEPYSFILQSIFDEGHQIHDKWQSWLAETGRLWGDWKCAALRALVQRSTREEASAQAFCCVCRNGEHLWEYAEVSLAHGLIQGHEDAALGDRLVEFKSVGIGTLRRESPGILAKYYTETVDGKKLYDLDGLWAGLKQPLMSHVRQANLYLWLARQMADADCEAADVYRSFTKASIVYEFKPNQQAREYVIPLSMDIVTPLLERARVVQWALDAGTPPPCRLGGCSACKAFETDLPEQSHRSRKLVHRGSRKELGGDD